jgi:hypothetical protein
LAVLAAGVAVVEPFMTVGLTLAVAAERDVGCSASDPCIAVGFIELAAALLYCGEYDVEPNATTGPMVATFTVDDDVSSGTLGLCLDVEADAGAGATNTDPSSTVGATDATFATLDVGTIWMEPARIAPIVFDVTAVLAVGVAVVLPLCTMGPVLVTLDSDALGAIDIEPLIVMGAAEVAFAVTATGEIVVEPWSTVGATVLVAEALVVGDTDIEPLTTVGSTLAVAVALAVGETEILPYTMLGLTLETLHVAGDVRIGIEGARVAVLADAGVGVIGGEESTTLGLALDVATVLADGVLVVDPRITIGLTDLTDIDDGAGVLLVEPSKTVVATVVALELDEVGPTSTLPFTTVGATDATFAATLDGDSSRLPRITIGPDTDVADAIGVGDAVVED